MFLAADHLIEKVALFNKAIKKVYRELNKKIAYKEVLKSLKKRDKSDKERKHGPLKKTKDSILAKVLTHILHGRTKTVLNALKDAPELIMTSQENELNKFLVKFREEFLQGVSALSWEGFSSSRSWGSDRQQRRRVPL